MDICVCVYDINQDGLSISKFWLVCMNGYVCVCV